MEKITNKIALTYVLENCSLPTDIHEKIEKILASVEKKNGGSGTSEKQMKNARLGDLVIEVLGDKTMTVSEVLKAIGGTFEDEEISHSKLNSVVTSLKRDGRVIREEVKGKAYFHVA